MGGILIPYFAYAPDIRFPGLSALPPVAGAALLIWSGTRVSAEHRSTVHRLLASRPLVWIGLISYSLYLWHWPFFAFRKYRGFNNDSWPVQFALVAASIAAAWISLRFVEQPFRSRNVVRRRSVVFALGATALASLMLPSLALWKTRGAEHRLTAQARRFAAGQSDKAFIHNLTAADIPSRLVSLGAPGDTPSVFIWGDSHAMAVLPAVDAACKQLGIAGKAATHASTAPVLNWFGPFKYGLNEAAPSFNAAVLGYLCDLSVKHPPPLVVLAARWSGYLDCEDHSDRFIAALRDTITALHDRGIKVVFFEEVPMFEFEPPRSLALAVFAGMPTVNLHTTEDAHNARTSKQQGVLKILAEHGVDCLDPLPYFSDKTGIIRPADSGGVLWYDRHHLSTHGSMRLVPAFAERISAHIQAARAGAALFSPGQDPMREN